MTPKEKALKLCDAFYQFLPLEQHVILWAYDGWKNAKQCALIAVDEILNTIEYSSQADELSKVSYWEEVKNEINKL